ncbi:uncharacterized protein BDR25DRAFT_313473 [Lindgomyces ingoldianus]|uniref:Uncharacterized protein n=1 Tax=Lindgomyces ingoldianus TaxID=673940 RepID=A0ACB6QZ96_9PLEO|nr:uncharacterized protein BDR25DRAFT_313473 [Lindgomyces ingoldianus]KAF2471516.1 hypothetical protein BDR25DRAFT_313473 [Lindgomyces ingoldianus]
MSFITQSTLTILVLTLASTGNAAAIRRRQLDLGIASLVAVAVASASLAPYIKAPQPVETILAIGDSFSAGIGSNGRPDFIEGSFDCRRYTSAWPCSRQVEQNGATLTVAPSPSVWQWRGIHKPENCHDTLADIDVKVASTDFKNTLIKTMIDIVAAGRLAGGPTPPEAFEVYLAGYAGFWNHDDPGCNDISWPYASWSTPPKLTTGLRLHMNTIVTNLNNALAAVAQELNASSVRYVDGINATFDTHRFCEPADPECLKRPLLKVLTTVTDNRSWTLLFPTKLCKHRSPPRTLLGISTNRSTALSHGDGSGYGTALGFYAGRFLDVIHASRAPAPASPTLLPSPAPAPQPPAILAKYTIHLHQKMEQKTSSLERTLLDSNGENVAGPDPNKDIPAANNRNKVAISVDSPTNKDKTNIKFTLKADGGDGCNPEWNTARSGGSEEPFIAPCQKGKGEDYGCGDVDATWGWA